MSDPWTEYLTDAAQRTVLFWDVMRERGNQFIEYTEEEVPHVLSFDYELVLNGAELPRPVNYALVRIPPGEGIEIDPRKRPFVVIDPRAGHGPGIGGFKADSEIGFAMRAGHACYYVGFLPDPVPGQTIEDVMKAEVAFIEKVIDLHPDAEGKPAVIGNCQGGWATMMLASYRPDVCGPLIIAGAPVSYWSGVRGANPMRYFGGLYGGSWLTALTSDMGNGIFDGAWLIANFEGLNPANTLWSKQYNLYSKVDSERERYLGFERYWGGLAKLNAEEIQFIVDNLFVGNKLSTAEIKTSDNVSLDFRKITSPIVVFCSKGDNITPPQQALGWILDLYESVDDIQACGQTIVYAVHETIGHLGIFVSGGVAKKEHREFTSNIDLIDCLPPGLYEAVLTPKSPEAANVDLISTDYLARFEPRTLDDIRALGGNDQDDDRAFSAVARLSEINLGLYRLYGQPLVRALSGDSQAEFMRTMHPLRLGFTMFSDRNPWMGMVRQAAEAVRENRTPVDGGNPFLAQQEAVSRTIANALDAYRDWRDRGYEQTFWATFGQPWLQAVLGLSAEEGPSRQRPGQTADHAALIERKIADLTDRMDKGGPGEAGIRALIYVAGPQEAADEREFAILQQLCREHDVSLEEFKTLVREQYFMLILDEEKALATIPALLAGQEEEAKEVLEQVRRVSAAAGKLEPDAQKRLEDVEKLFAAQTADKPAARQPPGASAPRPSRRSLRNRRAQAPAISPFRGDETKKPLSPAGRGVPLTGSRCPPKAALSRVPPCPGTRADRRPSTRPCGKAPAMWSCTWDGRSPEFRSSACAGPGRARI